VRKLNELSSRERILVLGGGALAAFLLYLGIFLLPTIAHIKKTQKAITLLAKEWAQLQTVVQDYRNLPTVAPPPERVSLLSFLEQSGNVLQIEKKVAYLKPFTVSGKKEGAEIKLDNVTGEEIIKLTHRLQQARITIIKINLRDHNMDGLWTAKIFLEG
jgi:type II secretory pathway component PulM